MMKSSAQISLAIFRNLYYRQLQSGSKSIRTIPSPGAVITLRQDRRIYEVACCDRKFARKGVSEYKIDFGPGYRIYFGQEGDELVILLGGGAKKTQDKDIQIAQMLWAEYKQAKERKK